jgi:hypothetical protein
MISALAEPGITNPNAWHNPTTEPSDLIFILNPSQNPKHLIQKNPPRVKVSVWELHKDLHTVLSWQADDEAFKSRACPQRIRSSIRCKNEFYQGLSIFNCACTNCAGSGLSRVATVIQSSPSRNRELTDAPF